MIKTILGAIALAIVALLVYAATQPDTFSIQRSATITAPPQRLFALISDVRAFNTWNPFAKKDPAIKLAYEGAASGVGAAYTWHSDEVGAGRMEIIEAAAPNRVASAWTSRNPSRLPTASSSGCSRKASKRR